MTRTDTSAPARPPRDDLVRSLVPGPELSEGGSGIGKLRGHFAVFNEWTDVDSVFEGRFKERIAPGAFTKAIKENRSLQPLFDHGQDQQFGRKPLGPITDIGEDERGAYYEVDLLDTSYNRDLVPGLRAGVYGSSFRFSVTKEDFVARPQRSAHNPDQLPERTVREVRLADIGPTPFPVYPGATAGMRSMTDEFMVRKLAEHPDRTVELIRSLQPAEGTSAVVSSTTVETSEPALPAAGADDSHSDEGSRSEQSPLNGITEWGSNSAKAMAEAIRPAQPESPPAVAAPTTEENRSVNTIEERRSRIDEINARFSEIQGEHGVDVLPDAIQTEWDGLVEERSNHQKAIDAYESRAAVLQQAATRERSLERVGEAPTVVNRSQSRLPSNIYALEEYRSLSSSPEQERSAMKDGAKRAIEIAAFPHQAADENRNKKNLETLLAQDESGEFARHLLTTGNPVYQRAFAKVIAGKLLTSEEQRAIMTVGTTTTGGYNVPFTLDPTLILTSDGSVNPLRSMARVEQLTQGNTWKGVTTAGVTITRGPAEMQPVTPTEVTFGQPEVTVQPVKVEIQFSIEADEDWPRLQTELARILQEAKDDEEAESFVNGVGTTVYPEGVVYGLDASSDVGTTGDGLDVSDLYRLEGALPPRYQARAQFLAHRAIYASIRQFSVGATGEGSVWTRGIAAGDPAQLLGYPAQSVSTMESDPTADGERIMLFGDFRAGFIIVDKVGMTIEIDPHVRNGDGKWVGARALLAHYRNSSKVINDNALRALVVGVVTS